MNKSDLLKALDSEYKAADKKVNEIEAELEFLKDQLEYWSRQKGALHIVNLRIMLEVEKEKKQAKQEDK